MNEEKQFKNRKWVIRAAVIFFAVMLLLLFFSNTIYNYSLPQVTVVYSSPGQMTTAIKGTGNVEAVKVTKVLADGTHKVASVQAALYDDVTVGDILVSFEETKLEDNEELKAAQAALDALLKQQYTENLQKVPHDYSMDERSISDALDALNKAKTTLTSAQSKASVIAAAQSDAAAKESALTQRQSELDTINLQKDGKIAAVATAQTNLYAAQDAYRPYSDAVSNAQAELDIAKGELAAIPAGGDTTAAQAKVTDKQTALNAAVATAAPFKATVDSMQAVYDTAAADLDTFAKTVTAKTAEVDAATKSLSDAQTKLTEAQALPSVEDASETVKLAQRSYDDSVKALADKKKADGVQDIINSLGDEEAKKAIIDAQKKVDSLKKILTQTEIVAPVSGRISQINASEGSDTNKGDVLFVIDDLTQGYKVSMPFTTEQVTKGQMVVGMGARQEYSWGGDQDDANIVSIKADPQSPRDSKIVTFLLNSNTDYGGSYYSGSSITLTLNNRSQNYECIIPLSAVHEESGETFVYSVKTKSSPLGDRYIAVKVPVTVIARDDTNAAISPEALGEYGSSVITETNDKSFQSGDQVRLAED